MKRRADPVANLMKGVIIPVARSFTIVGLVFIGAFITVLRTKDGNWFFYIMLGSLPIMWLFERSQRAKRLEEREASDQLFGIDRE